MRILVGALTLALLGGCSNVADIRTNPAVLSLSSGRPAKAVAECIRDGWQSKSIVGGSIGGVLQQSGEAFAVVAPNSESPWHVVDVISTANGSSVEYRFYRAWQSPNSKVTEVVKDCSK